MPMKRVFTYINRKSRFKISAIKENAKEEPANYFQFYK